MSIASQLPFLIAHRQTHSSKGAVTLAVARQVCTLERGRCLQLRPPYLASALSQHTPVPREEIPRKKKKKQPGFPRNIKLTQGIWKRNSRCLKAFPPCWFPAFSENLCVKIDWITRLGQMQLGDLLENRKAVCHLLERFFFLSQVVEKRLWVAGISKDSRLSCLGSDRNFLQRRLANLITETAPEYVKRRTRLSSEPKKRMPRPFLPTRKCLFY